MNFSPDHDDERISAFIDGQMTAEDRARFVAAMHADPSLQQRVEDFQRLSAELRELPSQNLSEDFADRLLATAEFQRAWRERFGPAAADRVAGVSVGVSPNLGAGTFSEWSVAIAAIGSLAAMLLLTLFWPALFDSGSRLVARRAEEETQATSAAAMNGQATEAGEHGAGAVAHPDEPDDAMAGLMAKSGLAPGVEPESAMKVNSAEAFQPIYTGSRMGITSPGQTNPDPSGRMRMADVIEGAAENADGGRIAAEEAEPSAPRAQMALVAPSANKMAAKSGAGDDVARKQAADDSRSAASQRAPEDSRQFSQSAARQMPSQAGLMAQNALLMNNAAGPLNVVQVEIPQDDDAIEFVEEVFSSNRLVVMSSNAVLPPNSELPQSAGSAQQPSVESGHEKSAEIARADGNAGVGGGGGGLGQAAPSAGGWGAGHMLTNDVEALYAIASPEQMQKVVLDLSTRAQVSMFRLSENELAQQVEALTLTREPMDSTANNQADDETVPLSDSPPTIILNFSQRMEMGPAKGSVTGGPAQQALAGNDAARRSAPDGGQMARRAVDPPAAVAESASVDNAPSSIVSPGAEQRQDMNRQSQSAGQTAQRASDRNSPVIPEGVDPVQISELNAYFQLPLPGEKVAESSVGVAEPAPRMEQFILLIRRSASVEQSRPADGNLDER